MQLFPLDISIIYILTFKYLLILAD